MKKVVALLAVLLLLAGLLLGVLFCSESGLRSIGAALVRYSGGMVSIGQVHGRLLDTCSFEALTVSTPGAQISVDSLEWSWNPQRLLVGEVRFGNLAARGVQLGLREDPDTKPEKSGVHLPTTLLPFSLVLENVLVERLVILDSGSAQLLAIASIEAGLRGNGRQVHIDRLAVEGTDTGFALHGSVEAGENLSVDVLGKWHLAGFGFHPLQGSFSVQGPVAAPHVEFATDTSGAIRVGLDVMNLLEEPKWTGTIAATGVDLAALIVDCPQILLATVEADMHGDIGHYRGFIKAVGAWDRLEGMELAGQIDGDSQGIDFESLRIERDDSLAAVKKGRISWRNIFGWEGRFSFKNIDPAVINEVLPGQITTEFASKGEVTDKGVVASFNIATLEGRLRGRNVSARGNVVLDGTSVHMAGLTVMSGDVQGRAEIDKAMFSWAENPSWAADISLKNFDPVVLHPEIYGKVNAHLSGSGRRGETGIEGHVSIRDLSGSLRGHKLSGGGDIQLRGNTMSTAGLAVSSGLSKLILHGRAGDDPGVNFTFRTPDISALLPGAAGKVSVDGSLSGDLTAPRLGVAIESDGLRYDHYTAGQLRAHLQAQLTDGGYFAGKVEGKALELSGATVDDIKVDFSGELKDHEVIVDASAADLQVEGRVRGGYDNGQWQGTLGQFLLQKPRFGSWIQKRDVVVSLGSSIKIDELCMEDGSSGFCLGGSLITAGGGHWEVHGNVLSVPLDFIHALTLIPVQLQGAMSGQFAAAGDIAEISAASLQLTVPDLSLLTDSDYPETYPFHLKDSSVRLDLVDGSLHGDLTTLMENDGKVAIEATVEDFGTFSDSLQGKKIAGRFQVNDFDLSMLEGFVAYGVEPAGLLNTAVTLGGTLGQPTLEGNVAIKNGGIELLYQGVTLSDVTLSLSGQGRQAKISGTVASGPGRMQMTGDLAYNESGVGGVLYLRSQDFLLVDLPEYSIRAASDVQFKFNSGGGRITGRVEVPHGLLMPEEMVNSVGVSDDVVFVNGEVPEEQARRWPLMLDLEVVLGDDVRLDGYGLTGRLGGRLHVNSSKDNILKGRGQLDLIDGIFSLYGRTLNIKRGRVLFTGGPLDNPGLDVRAQVTVTDEQAGGKGYTVGVDISGLVQDLQFTLFSDPYMEDTEILSLMIAGQSLAGVSGEQGNILKSAAASLGLKGSSKLVEGLGKMLPIDDVHLEGGNTKEDFSLVVGKRLTDDLYIGYDVNMFSQLGQFRVRYDLKKGFYVETRSSSAATGADLLYSFER